MKKNYTISVYGENKVGLMNRVCTLLTQRGINIENFIAAETEIVDVFKLTFVVVSEKVVLEKVIHQIEKIIDTHRAFLHEPEDIIYQEMGLYKIATNKLSAQLDLENVIRQHQARVLSIMPDYFVLEKTGHSEELQELLNALEPYGVIEFSRSGRATLVKWSRHFHDHLKVLSKQKEIIFE